MAFSLTPKREKENHHLLTQLFYFQKLGNTGLGYEIVKALYASSAPYDLIIGTRTLANGEAAVTTLQSEVPSPSSPSSTISVLQLDVTSDASIEAAVTEINSRHNGRLDVLINNAGAAFDDALKSGALTLRETFNKTWDVNVAGTHVLTTLAAPLLLQSADPRLVFMTSGTSSLWETEEENWGSQPVLARINASPEKGWPKPAGPQPLTMYRTAKTGLNMLMRDWARVLKNDGVKVWAVSPGFLATGLGGQGPDVLKRFGAAEPSVGGEFVRGVVEGKYDHVVGKVIKVDKVQPW